MHGGDHLKQSNLLETSLEGHKGSPEGSNEGQNFVVEGKQKNMDGV